MSLLVRSVEFESEREAFIAALQKQVPYLPHARLFPWLYCRNPNGAARAWVAVDSGNDEIVGVAAAFPRRIRHCGSEALGYLLGDFGIDVRHRSLGLAVALQRACLEGLAECGAKFVIDFPSDSMLSVYKRLRIDGAERLVRYAKPLRVDRKMARAMPIRLVANAASALGNAGIRIRDRHLDRLESCTVTAEKGPWGEELNELINKCIADIAGSVIRTAAYLNWRYYQHPEREYIMLTARRSGALVGYAICQITNEDWYIDDLLAENDEVRRSLVVATLKIARERHVHTISAPWLSTDAAAAQIFESCHFRARESRPVVLLEQSKKAAGFTPVRESGWHLTRGDAES